MAKQPRNPAVEEELKRQIAAKQIAGGGADSWAVLSMPWATARVILLSRR